MQYKVAAKPDPVGDDLFVGWTYLSDPLTAGRLLASLITALPVTQTLVIRESVRKTGGERVVARLPTSCVIARRTAGFARRAGAYGH